MFAPLEETRPNFEVMIQDLRGTIMYALKSSGPFHAALVIHDQPFRITKTLKAARPCRPI